MPAYKLKGESAVLECVFELEGFENLYAVKWYRENEEFYRWVPKFKPSQISYKVDGIRIDVSVFELHHVITKIHCHKPDEKCASVKN